MDPDAKPLFGETPPKNKVAHYSAFLIATAAVVFTAISVFAYKWPPRGINVIFAGTIIIQAVSPITMIRWYREGDVDPKFLKLIYYNTFALILFCITCNLYVFQVRF